MHVWVPVTLSGLFGLFISHCFMSVYEVMISCYENSAEIFETLENYALFGRYARHLIEPSSSSS